MVRSCQRCQRVSTLSAPLGPDLQLHKAGSVGVVTLTPADTADGKAASKPPPARGVSAVSLARAETPRLFTPSSLFLPPSPFSRNPLTPLTPPPLAAPPRARRPRRLLRPFISPARVRNSGRPQ